MNMFCTRCRRRGARALLRPLFAQPPWASLPLPGGVIAGQRVRPAGGGSGRHSARQRPATTNTSAAAAGPGGHHSGGPAHTSAPPALRPAGAPARPADNAPPVGFAGRRVAIVALILDALEPVLLPARARPGAGGAGEQKFAASPAGGAPPSLSTQPTSDTGPCVAPKAPARRLAASPGATTTHTHRFLRMSASRSMSIRACSGSISSSFRLHKRTTCLSLLGHAACIPQAWPQRRAGPACQIELRAQAAAAAAAGGPAGGKAGGERPPAPACQPVARAPPRRAV